MEINWINFSNKSISIFGSSSCILNNIVYIIGGIDQNSNNNSESHNNIRIITFNLITMIWDSIMINTNGILNRSYHASEIIGSNIYTFGGSTILGNLNEIIEISITLEEVKCKVSKFPNLGIIGLSASKFNIPNIGERIFLYGGISNNGNYISDIQIFESNEILENSKLTTLQIESETPPPRAYHSSIVCGDNKQLLIIHGGRNNTGLLNDIWILDISPLNTTIESTPVVDPKAKGVKGAKATPTTTPLPFWTQIILTTPLPNRCLHSSYVNSIGKKLSFHVFGGIGDYGIYSIDFFNIEINQDNGNKYTELSINIPNEQKSTQRYGFSTCDIKEDDKSVMLLVFGGIQKLNNQIEVLPELIVLDETSNIAQHSKSLLPELFPINDQSLNDLNVHIEYPSGDIYDGEILRDGDIIYRHGNGKMRYNNGSIYEGDWFNDIRHGKGKFYLSNNSHIYEGDFENDEYSGEGKLISIVETNKDGRSQNTTHEYIGTFKSSLYHGNGILKDTLLDTTYEGEFFEGLKSGQGQLIQTSTGKNIYNGEWYMDVPCGYGTFILNGGHIYTGYMKNGVPDGEGHCRYIDGGEYSGLWKNGRRNGYGSYVGPSLDEYKGKWVGDLRSGYGVWKSARGDIYDGLWDLDLPHNNGKVTYNIGENNTNPTREKIYQGGWNHGKRSGNGEVTYANGILKKGNWNCTTCDIAFVSDDVIESN